MKLCVIGIGIVELFYGRVEWGYVFRFKVWVVLEYGVEIIISWLIKWVNR